MMKASELRIGNLVNYQVGTSVFQDKVTAITEKRIVIGNVALKHACLQPILLTEEWLLKFGFYAKHHHDNFSFNGFEISSSQRRIDTNERSVFYLILTEDSKFNIRIEHVNQLQNLYFALTGEELTIKK